MPCFHPITAYATASGGIVFSQLKRHNINREIKIACGQCIGCRLERARQWAVRISHEAQLHEENSFLTLTYDDEHLPPDYSLRYRDCQLFLKKLRKKSKIRYFICGEYGALTSRPHYHAALFGKDFHEDRQPHGRSGDYTTYTSPTLDNLWQKGRAIIGDLTYQSANYIAGYIVDKLKDDQRQHLEIFDPETGEIYTRAKEFGRMSLRPAIGKEWLQLYWPEVIDGYVTHKGGMKTVAPKYYRKYFKNTEAYIDLMDNITTNINPTDQTHQRLQDRETVARAARSLKQKEPGT